MKIGLYFGTFNPIHIGHLIIANHVLNQNIFSEVWFIVSPQNPLKPGNSALDPSVRLHLIDLAIKNEVNLKACDIEFDLPRPSYTIDTLKALKVKYPKNEFSVILGSDSFLRLPEWKDYQTLVNNYYFFIYERPGFEINEPVNNAQLIPDTPLLNISSTRIRELIQNQLSIKYLVPDLVKDEIEKMGYYR
ncbi:MAG: nicotinate-nucleotide adenylyltransferase [Chitinophagaceae bacterium]|nr:nicotinate-nucleotide adenylyltransferase [Chitinophagaceae bacterium]